MGSAIDMIGRRFGRVVVQSEAARDKRNGRRWNCLCDCGNESIAYGTHLRGGDCPSCGCRQREASTKHGMYGTPTYRAWTAMVARCTNPKTKGYERYGGRGITVCNRWMDSFANFLADMGERPDRMSIERCDNEKGYSKENCRWATATEQARNRRSTHLVAFNGEALSVAEWAERQQINYSTLSTRLNSGWSIERALGTKGRGKPCTTRATS